MGATLATKTRSKGRRTGGTYRAMSDINVTPLVDVMLVLLIVFMVAAPLLTAGVAVDLPESKAGAISDEDNKPIEVTVAKDGKIYIGESEVKEGNLVNLLIAMTESKADQRLYIRADQGLSYGKVMKTIGAINAAGFNKVALISEQTSK